MKKKILTLLSMVLLVWLIPGSGSNLKAQDNGTADNPNSSDYNNQNNNPDDDQYNVDDLNQYGDWENVNPYGRVWHPSVITNWQPFTNGHWTYDGTDWVWVSYEPFGWIVYHYGSWEYSDDYGWLWIPGTDEWSPARVQWIDYGDNIGWAPMRFNNRNWPEPWVNNKVHPWMVVRTEDFNKENITSYGVPNASRFNRVKQNQIQRRQPNLKFVQRHVKDPIKIVKIDKQQQIQNKTQPVRSNIPPVRNDVAPVRNISPTERNDIPPVRNITPPVRNDNTSVRTVSPPVINRNTTNLRPPNNRNLIHMQVPPEEKQKVDRYSPNVRQNVLIKRNPRPNVNPAPRTEENNRNGKK
jgi:hypothetical protein